VRRAPLAWVADVDVPEVVGRHAMRFASSRDLPEHVQRAAVADADDREFRGIAAGHVEV
jgi:hypothetical protein